MKVKDLVVEKILGLMIDECKEMGGRKIEEIWGGKRNGLRLILLISYRFIDQSAIVKELAW